MASGIIRMSACLGDVTKALNTWQLVVSKGVSRKRRMYGALLQLLGGGGVPNFTLFNLLYWLYHNSFTSTKVQILTQKRRMYVERCCSC
jgi:hypothetical protein